MLEIGAIVIMAAVAVAAVGWLRRRPEVLIPEDDDPVDLPCPWCHAQTREDDVVCPGCRQPFGVLSREPSAPARRS
jgi:hypothetical protein